MGQRLNLHGKLKVKTVGVAKASLKWATQSCELDPKPGDLTMSRLKVE